MGLRAEHGSLFEFVKIAKQTKPHMSYAELTREMTAQKGLIGVFVPSVGTVQAVSKGAVFVFAHAKEDASPLQHGTGWHGSPHGRGNHGWRDRWRFTGISAEPDPVAQDAGHDEPRLPAANVAWTTRA